MACSNAAFSNSAFSQGLSSTERWSQWADSVDVVTLSLSDEDFGKLVNGKTQAQRLFMSGKLKIKGDVMKVGCRMKWLPKILLLTRRLTGYKDGACFEKGPDEGKVVDSGKWTASDMASFRYG